MTRVPTGGFVPESGDVSFIVDDQDGPSGEEVLTGGGLPRWTWLLAAVGAVALVVGLLVAHAGHGPRTPAAALQSPVPRPSVSGDLPVGGVPAAFDVAITPRAKWVLEADTLVRVDGTRVIRSVHVARLNGLQPYSVPRLAVDPAAQRLWAVSTNSSPTVMAEFDMASMRLLRELTWRQPVRSAAAYRGHLYVSTDRGVADLSPGRTAPQFIAGLSGAVGPLAVDPSRHRLIAMDYGFPTDIWTYRPGGRPVEAAGTLAFGKGTIAVVRGAIWVGGDGTSGAVLERLDPHTLRPVTHSALASELDPGAMILAAGRSVLWLAADGITGPVLICADGATGLVEQRWKFRSLNAVASDAADAMVATGDGVLGLVLSSCRG
jgi:hypothetical protein